jgi:hypothetical protein
MKPVLLALVLPLLLTGCAAYVGDYGPGYPGYYGYDYDGPAYIGFYGGGGGYYHHDYHHYDTGYHHGGGTVAYHGSYHASGHFASVSHASGHVGGGGGRSASVSMGHR